MALLLAAPGASAREPTPSCQVGAYLSDIYDIDVAANTFNARVWVWSLCPTRDIDPLSDLSYPNASSRETSNDERTRTKGLYRHLMLVVGTFRQDFDTTNFPFDRQRLEILMTAPKDINRFHFEPDTTNSSAREDISVPDWGVTGFHVTSYTQHYSTNYGDLDLPPDAGSAYSRIRLVIDLSRADQVTFLKTIGPLILIFFVTVLTFLVTTREAATYRTRITALGATLFAVLLNMNRADDVVQSESLTMLDQLHILTLLLVVAAIGVTTLAWRWSLRGYEEAQIAALDRRAVLIGSAAYVVAFSLIVALGAAAG